MVIAKIILKETLLYSGDFKQLGKVFQTSNDTLAKSNEANMFVTVFTGILNTKTGEFTHANAGHNPPIIKSGEKPYYIPKAKNPIMGAIEGLNFTTSKLTLNKGDLIFLYTDGVTEARNTDRELFGETRLLDIVKGFSNNAESDIKLAYNAVKEFAKDAVQSDDITVLELVYN